MTPEITIAFVLILAICLSTWAVCRLISRNVEFSITIGPENGSRTTPSPTDFDMTTCAPGDLLFARDGSLCRYVGPAEYEKFSHKIEFVLIANKENTWGLSDWELLNSNSKEFVLTTRTDSGQVFNDGKIHSLDIVEKINSATQKALLEALASGINSSFKKDTTK